MSYKLRDQIKEIFQYKLALAGIGILLILIGISVYAVVAIPYDVATYLWRGGEGIWLDCPKNALPSWISLFSAKKIPETIVLDTQKGQVGVTKIIFPITANMSKLRIEFNFYYDYDDFPSEINLFYTAIYNERSPLVTIYWTKPTGQQIKIIDMVLKKSGAYYLSIDAVLANTLQSYLTQKTGTEPEYAVVPVIGLFAVEDSSVLKISTVTPLKGKYNVVIEGTLFEENSNVDVKLVVYGKIYGLAGTDHLRRDLSIALLWGTPIALSFGVVAALSIAVIQMIIAALSAWFLGKVDFTFQKITEINMILPFLPILIMLSVFYSFSIWMLLIVVIALNVFGSGVKTYRAVFLQIKEFPYIEAAKAYGASSLRIIFLYMIPKILPTIIPNLVMSVSSFVFLEAAMALLGLGDPMAPTWGKIIDDAYSSGALYKGYYYWVLEPSFLLILTSLGFALLGFALDKIFNPKLREM
ncbi:MAG: ABC transporter permease [Nitrososphaerota archaeon]|nr:ABC transporter permease [Candidatus Bathyarchaeota archaeon]MDW8049054.1 ABC transporter permease [Nitrososphaerota archaeon]